MQLFLHRANTDFTLQQADNLGIGVEVDIRTHLGVPFLSHDPIMTPAGVLKLAEALAVMKPGMPILLDFKETGIIHLVKEVLPDWAKECSLAIDLIAPDVYSAQSQLVKTLVRHSRHEDIEESRCSAYADYHAGYWLDYMQHPHDLEIIKSSCLWNVYVVSPELHRMALRTDFIKAVVENPACVGVCTDYPERWLEHIKR